MSSDPPPEDMQALALEGLLRWYAAMGVDAAVDEAAHDRFVPLPQMPQPSAVAHVSEAIVSEVIAPARRMAVSAPPMSRPADALAADARTLAAEATDLADLQARWAAVPGCTLAASSQMIPLAGPPGARVMLVAGAPGEDDEREGAPFSGAAGRLLDAMLRAIGLARTEVALAHVVPWRPPGNRAPTPLELSLCLPFLRRAIAFGEPRIVVCFGERAAQPLLGTREPMSRLRGRWLSYEGDGTTIKTLVTFAPSYLLGQPLQKRRAWADLLMLDTEIEAIGR